MHNAGCVSAMRHMQANLNGSCGIQHIHEGPGRCSGRRAVVGMHVHARAPVLTRAYLCGHLQDTIWARLPRHDCHLLLDGLQVWGAARLWSSSVLDVHHALRLLIH